MKYMICFAAPTPCLECQCFSTMQIFECSPACGEVFEPFVSRVQAIASCTANCCLKLSALNRLLRACCRCVLQWDQCGEMLVAAGMGGLDQMSAFYDHCLVALYVQP